MKEGRGSGTDIDMIIGMRKLFTAGDIREILSFEIFKY
jgi:hypothetical protein